MTSGKVLYVDNDQAMRDVVELFLGVAGKLVTVAVDGVEAAELLELVNPDVVVMDMVMPRMDGLDLCRVVREHPTLSHVPIILLTGCEATDPRVVQALRLPRTVLMAKTDIRALGDRVDSVLADPA